MSETNQPKPIPDPPDFPVIWENPDDAQLQWEYDTTHSTGPAPLLEFQAFWKTAFEGWSSANESLGIPLRIRATRLNTYFYIAILPAVAPEEMPEAMNFKTGRPLPAGLAWTTQSQFQIWGST